MTMRSEYICLNRGYLPGFMLIITKIKIKKDTNNRSNL